MLRITLVFFLISLSTLARASDWKYISLDSEGNKYYVDVESVLIEGDTRTFWVNVKYKEPKAASEGKIYASMKAQISINCAKRTFSYLVTQGLDVKGIPGDYVDYRGLPQYADQPIIPDSLSDGMRKYVCSIKKGAE
jgi:hypothetical protein